MEAFRKIAGRDGVAGLYQGMRANLLGSTFSWGLYFFLYGSLKNFMSDNGQTKLAAHHHMLAAAEAGKNTHTHSFFYYMHAHVHVHFASFALSLNEDCECERESVCCVLLQDLSRRC